MMYLNVTILISPKVIVNHLRGFVLVCPLDDNNTVKSITMIVIKITNESKMIITDCLYTFLFNQLKGNLIIKLVKNVNK